MEACPEHFYKYRSLDGNALAFAERTICHDEIWFPAPSTFNDPFDCHPTFDLEATVDEMAPVYARVLQRHNSEWTDQKCLEAAKDLAANPLRSPTSQEARDFIQQHHVEEIKNRIGVLCLSANPNSSLMWAHYADSHRGVCLRFNGFFPFFAETQKVNYPPQRRRINPFRNTQMEGLEAALLNKCEDWSYEEEWRIVNYENGPGVYRFPTKSLTGVIFGARIPPHHESSIRQWVASRDSPLQFFRARPSVDTYEIHIDEVD